MYNIEGTNVFIIFPTVSVMVSICNVASFLLLKVFVMVCPVLLSPNEKNVPESRRESTVSSLCSDTS